MTTQSTEEADLCLSAPTAEDFKEAEQALSGAVIKTPLLHNPEVDAQLGTQLLIKAETAQRTGSFKFRGAYNRVRTLSPADKKRGVIAYSSGNHAQAVACVAKLLDTAAHIVMPDDAPPIKVQRTRELGACITSYDRTVETRESVAQRIGEENNYVMVPPNEDRRVMAGAGTVALELFAQTEQSGCVPDAILVPCGGGGLTAATALVTEQVSPATKVYAVEPELFDDTRRSMQLGERVANPAGRHTICDAIMTDTPGELTFSINKSRLDGVLVVSDDEVRSAVLFAFEQFKVVVEPGAAVGLAAVLSRKIDTSNKTIAVIATGGNVDPSIYRAILCAD